MTLTAPLHRLCLWALVLLALPLVGLSPGASAQDAAEAEMRFVRIGTGPTGGTYFPMGGLIANAISNPPGSRPCDKGGSCGVPGLIAVAQSTHGAVANVDAVAAGRIELALAQADIAYWAYHGTGNYAGKGAVVELRGIGMLYQEAFHLVARKGAEIASVADLKGKRVSLGEPGSGTLVDAQAILEAFGLAEADVQASYMKPGASADALLAGEIDAFFFVAGAPIATISRLLETDEVMLVPIDGAPARALTEAYPFLLQGEIPADVYPNSPAVPTITVGAVLITSAAMPESLIYGITRALWHPNNRSLFVKGHPGGAQMNPEAATKGLGIPLHAGAANYYFDAGLME